MSHIALGIPSKNHPWQNRRTLHPLSRLALIWKKMAFVKDEGSITMISARLQCADLPRKAILGARYVVLKSIPAWYCDIACLPACIIKTL